MENIAEKLLKIFLPKEMDWKRYKLKKVLETEDNNIHPFVWWLEFHIEKLNIVPISEEYNWKEVIIIYSIFNKDVSLNWFFLWYFSNKSKITIIFFYVDPNFISSSMCWSCIFT